VSRGEKLPPALTVKGGQHEMEKLWVFISVVTMAWQILSSSHFTGTVRVEAELAITPGASLTYEPPRRALFPASEGCRTAQAG
jgi:hypothetical protein